MASIPAVEIAQEILDACLLYGTWPSRALDDLIERAFDEGDAFVAAAATRALFTVIVERLADLFDPALCEVYARLFARVIERSIPSYDAGELALRYRRISQTKRFIGGEIGRVFVLSRITLGADIAVTSVVLAAMKARFPDAEICFVGPTKNAEMFADDSRVIPIDVAYTRSGTLRQRLVAAGELRSILDETGSLVIDPDSRLTQLGLIPVCDDSRYYFFESRAFGGSTDLHLSYLTSAWCAQVFGVEGAAPYVALPPENAVADICLSWGVGENEDKRLGDSFEAAMTKALLAKGRPVLLDTGAGGAEKERATRLKDECSSPLLQLHEGPYASFASQIVGSKLYVGYDSVGQHVAAAANIPLISVFAGWPCERMLDRWRPRTPSANVIAVEEHQRDAAVSMALDAVASTHIPVVKPPSIAG